MQTNTGKTGIVKPQSPKQPSTDAQPQVPPHIAAKNLHIDEKTALIVGGVVAGLLMIWINSL